MNNINKNIVDLSAGAIEPMLRELIKKHGYPTVRATLETLVDKASWADYERVFNIAKNVSNRLEREKAAGYVRCPDHRNGGATYCPRGGPALQEFQRRMWEGK